MGLFNSRSKPEVDALRERLERCETALQTIPEPGGVGVREEVDRALDGILGVIESHRKKTEARLDAIELRLGDMVRAIDEGIQRTDRAERRVRAVVKRARQELGDIGVADDGLEAEAAELQLVDGEGSGSDRMRPVSTDVGSAAPEASSVKGVPLAALRRVRGMAG